MKRNAMIEVIKKVWADSTSWPSDQIVADKILEAIEKAGMVPPIIPEKSYTMLPNGELTYAVHEWEPEDDKT